MRGTLGARGSTGVSGVAGGWRSTRRLSCHVNVFVRLRARCAHARRSVCARFCGTQEEDVMRYRPLGSDPLDPRLGRFIPDDWQHVERYPLSALTDEDRPTNSPVVIGVNWYTE